MVALYDFEAQADGDLSFKSGDRIELVERTDSSEDWWTGKVDGRQGVFPGASPSLGNFSSLSLALWHVHLTRVDVQVITCRSLEYERE